MTSPTKTQRQLRYLLLVLLFVWAFLINISYGSVEISISNIIESVMGNNLQEPQLDYIIHQYRIPKAITAVIVGAGLSISGLLMQTLFKNPLAGPYVLGVSSGASLGAALYLMGASALSAFLPHWLMGNWSTTIAASLGSFTVLFIVSAVATRIKNTMALLIIGLMFGSLSSAIVSILAFFSSKESLQRFVFWTYGNLGNLRPSEIGILGLFVGIGSLLSILNTNALNTMLLGDDYAISLGVSLKKTHLIILITTGLIAGSITALVGPIAFLGLAVPHICRLIWDTSNHKILIPTCLIMGAIFMLISDSISQLPGSANVLPINAVTALFGSPIVIWLLIRKKQIQL
jgi:iron complex transport system permease protein